MCGAAPGQHQVPPVARRRRDPIGVPPDPQWRDRRAAWSRWLGPSLRARAHTRGGSHSVAASVPPMTHQHISLSLPPTPTLLNAGRLQPRGDERQKPTSDGASAYWAYCIKDAVGELRVSVLLSNRSYSPHGVPAILRRRAGMTSPGGSGRTQRGSETKTTRKAQRGSCLRFANSIIKPGKSYAKDQVPHQKAFLACSGDGYSTPNK